MNIHNIIIFEFDSLYKILSEIKNNLPFKINNLKKLESKDESFVKYSLIITNYNKRKEKQSTYCLSNSN